MTFLAKDIRDHLAGSDNIANEFSNRMFPDVAPQGVEHPWINISDLTNEPEYYLGGEAGLHTTVIQVDVWTDGSGKRAEANRLGELVRNRLNGYRGQFGAGCTGTARMIRNNTVTAPPVNGSDQHRWRVSMDFEVIHTADVPDFT